MVILLQSRSSLVSSEEARLGVWERKISNVCNELIRAVHLMQFGQIDKCQSVSRPSLIGCWSCYDSTLAPFDNAGPVSRIDIPLDTVSHTIDSLPVSSKPQTE